VDDRLVTARTILVASGALIALSPVAAHAARSRTTGVALVSLSRRVEAGNVAYIGVDPTPWTARCSLSLEAGTYVRKPAARETRTALVWKWRLRQDAPRGRSPVVVDCARSGALRTHFVIVWSGVGAHP